MDPDFWHKRWHDNQIGFHEAEANSLLVRHAPALSLGPASRVFVPLSGKTRDIAWFLSQGHAVVAVELSALAIHQLFEDLGAAPKIVQAGPLQHFSAPNLDVYVGDFFDLTAGLTGHVDAVYDRAALVALPQVMRTRYAAHLRAITHNARQLLICFEYDQAQFGGPPFSVDAAEIARLYEQSFTLSQLESRVLSGKLAGRVTAVETAWLLR